MPTYNSPGTLGPTSSEPSNGFDYNVIVSQAGSIVNSFLDFGASIYNANHQDSGQVIMPSGSTATAPAPVAQPAATSSNMWMWIGGGLLLLLLLAGILYAVKKS